MNASTLSHPGIWEPPTTLQKCIFCKFLRACHVSHIFIFTSIHLTCLQKFTPKQLLHWSESIVESALEVEIGRSPIGSPLYDLSTFLPSTLIVMNQGSWQCMCEGPWLSSKGNTSCLRPLTLKFFLLESVVRYTPWRWAWCKVRHII